MTTFGGLFSRLLPKRTTPSVRIVDLGAAKGPVYAIGDLHGCRSLMRMALDGIRKDAGRAKHTVILLGDLIDRGPDSAGVLDDLTALPPDPPVHSVLGNHERMMLSFLDDPLRSWDWLQQGGFETLQSYGLSLPPHEKQGARRLRQMLAAHIPDHHVDWLKALPQGYKISVGQKRYLFTHAGIDSTRPLEAQRESALLWGRDVSPPASGLCVVQGHVIVQEAQLSERLIRIDTGAYLGGNLTVVRFSPTKPPSVMSFGAKTD